MVIPSSLYEAICWNLEREWLKRKIGVGLIHLGKWINGNILNKALNHHWENKEMKILISFQGLQKEGLAVQCMLRDYATPPQHIAQHIHSMKDYSLCYWPTYTFYERLQFVLLHTWQRFDNCCCLLYFWSHHLTLKEDSHKFLRAWASKLLHTSHRKSIPSMGWNWFPCSVNPVLLLMRGSQYD